MEYKLIRSGRRTLCLEIKNATLVVRAPFFYPESKINQFVLSKQSWIAKHLSRAKTKPKRKPDEIYVKGKSYCIKFTDRENGSVRILGNKMIVPAKNEIQAQEKMRNFVKSETKKMVEKILKKYLGYISDQDRSKIIFKFYKSKWGSCSSRNKLSFNAVLAMAPEEVVEYVVIHEIVHIKIKNHSSKFWKRVEGLDPKYKSHRKWLAENRDMLRL